MGHYDEQREKYEDNSSDIEWRCDDCGLKHFKGELRCNHCSIYESVEAAKSKHSHYHKDVSQCDTIDIYVICDLYVKDNSGCIQHAVKKLLCCGERGVKDNVKDLQEAIDTIQRKIEILQGKSEAADD